MSFKFQQTVKKNIKNGWTKIVALYTEIKYPIYSYLKKRFRQIKGLIPRNKYSLRYIVELEKKRDESVQEILKKKAEPLWIPSFHSFLVITIWFVLFWVLSHSQYVLEWFIIPFKNLLFDVFGASAVLSSIADFFKQFVLVLSSWNIPFIDVNENHYQNFITIHAGIGAVLIGLAFFNAQSLTDKSEPERGRVLLYKSLFFPLLTGEILFFFLFLWGDMNIIGILPTTILGLATIFALGRTIDILLKDHEMEKAKRKMFFEILRKNFVKILDFEITKRLGNNKLYAVGEVIQKENPGLLEITPFGAVFKKGYVQIKSLQIGTIAFSSQ